MTFLVGQQGTGWTIVSDSDINASGNAIYFGSGYTASATGTMSTAQFYVPSTSGQGVATRAIIFVYSGTGAGASFVAQSSPIVINSTTGLNSAAISGSITSGQSYTLVMATTNTAGTQGGFPNTACNSGSAGNACAQDTSAHFSTSSPPSTLPTPDIPSGGGNSGGKEFIVWIDGTVGGGPPPMRWDQFGAFGAQVAQ